MNRLLIAICLGIFLCPVFCVIVLSILFPKKADVRIRQLTYDLSSNGRHAVVSTGSGTLYFLDLKTGNTKTLSFPGGPQYSCFPTFSPDNREIAFSGDLDLWIGSVDGSNLRRLTRDNTYSEIEPRFSPDGKQLVFERPTNLVQSFKGNLLEHDVWLIRTDGTDLRRLTKHRYFEVSGPCFRSDGKAVFYAADVPPMDMGSRKVLYEMPTHGITPPRVLFGSLSEDEVSSTVSNPALSPDGTQFVCISGYNQPFPYDITLLSVEGKLLRRLNLGKQSGDVDQPRFSADGKSIYYLRGATLWQANLQGKEARKIATL